jgi:hypothetical protein
MRWLGCPCDMCWQRQYDHCVNKQSVGQRVPREVRQTATQGVAGRRAEQELTWKQCAQAIKKGDYVACYTDGDAQYPRVKYWVGRVLQVAHQILDDDTECPSLGPTGPTFLGPRGDSPGQIALTVQWLERRSTREADDLTFHAVSDDPHLVHASTLRKVGMVLTEKIVGTKTFLALSGQQHTGIMASQRLYED